MASRLTLVLSTFLQEVELNLISTMSDETKLRTPFARNHSVDVSAMISVLKNEWNSQEQETVSMPRAPGKSTSMILEPINVPFMVDTMNTSFTHASRCPLSEFVKRQDTKNFLIESINLITSRKQKHFLSPVSNHSNVTS